MNNNNNNNNVPYPKAPATIVEFESRGWRTWLANTDIDPRTGWRSLRGAIAAGRNPRDVKFELAGEIVARFHGAEAAVRAQAEFVARFAQKSLPTDLPLTSIAARDADGETIVAALKAAGLAASNSEAVRKLAEGAVRIDGEKVQDRDLRLPVGAAHILQVGPRRFARVKIEKPI
jgi:tyrosyl-tRNA synthetase